MEERMRALGLVLVIGLGGCSGGDKAYGTTTFSADTGSPPPTDDVRDCASVPVVDPRGMSCEQITDAWVDVTGAMKRCNATEECRAAPSPCANGIDVACFAEVNNCPGLDTSAFDQASNGLCEPPDQREVCQCGSAPPLICLNNICQFDLGSSTN